MKDYTLIKKFKLKIWDTHLQSEIIPKYGIRIRKTKKSKPYWELSSKYEELPQIIFDELVMFAYHYHFVVELIKRDYNDMYKSWYTWIINIEREEYD